MPEERLKSRCLFVPTGRKLFNGLSKLGIHAAHWTKYGWSAEYSKRTSVLHVFIPKPVLGHSERACPEHLGLSLIACGLVLGIFTRPCTNESRSLAELRVWRHRSNRRPRDLNTSHKPSTSRGGWLDGFG